MIIRAQNHRALSSLWLSRCNQEKKRKEKHNPDGTGGCVKKCLWGSKNFDIMGTGTPEPGERQEDKCT